MPIRVLHWINLSRLYRCHLTFENTDEVTHYYITDTKRHVLRSKPNVFTGGVRNIGFLNKILSQVKPDVVICSNLIDAQYMRTMKNGCKLLIYIHHTLWTDDIMDKKIKGARGDGTFNKYNIFDKIYCTAKENDFWEKIGISRSKLVDVRGLTYMDPLLIFDKNSSRRRVFNFLKIPENQQEEMAAKKWLILVHNNTLTGCLNPGGGAKSSGVNAKDYEVMLGEMVKWAEENNGMVIAKIGRRSSTLSETSEIKRLHKLPCVRVVRPESCDLLLADFLFCDVVINQSYSAAYQEALMVNPCSCCCYLKGKEIVDSKLYPHLPVMRSAESIGPQITDYIENAEKYRTDPEVQSEINALIEATFGGRFENVTDKVVNDIKTWYADLDKNHDE